MFRLRTLGAAAALIVTLAPAAASAQVEWTSSRPDGHAPIGVMGDHMHSKGEFMLSYRFMRMWMEGNRTGTDAVSNEAVLNDFMVAPTEMPMNMHMFGAMFAPSDRITLMGMLPYIDMEMDHVTRMGGTFTTSSSGIGDVKLGGLIGLKQEGSTRAHLNATLSLPTGSIDRTDVTPASSPNETQLPYPMQIGSGTVDFTPGVTLLGMSERGSWGLQGKGTFRFGENDREYTLGNVLEGTGWLAWRLSDQFSASLRGTFRDWGEIDGADPTYMNLMMVPTVNPNLRGGSRFDAGFGVNWSLPGESLSGHRLLVEFNLPVWQDLNGPQLETDGVLTLGWQKSFEPIGGHH